MHHAFHLNSSCNWVLAQSFNVSEAPTIGGERHFVSLTIYLSTLFFLGCLVLTIVDCRKVIVN